MESGASVTPGLQQDQEPGALYHHTDVIGHHTLSRGMLGYSWRCGDGGSLHTVSQRWTGMGPRLSQGCPLPIRFNLVGKAVFAVRGCACCAPAGSVQ